MKSLNAIHLSLGLKSSATIKLVHICLVSINFKVNPLLSVLVYYERVRAALQTLRFINSLLKQYVAQMLAFPNPV